MSLSYANILDRVEQLLQDTSNAIYDVTELGYWMEDELKRISRYDPLIVEVVFQIESRRGTDVTGTASSLTDSVKNQFLTTDPTNEKVVHNITDDTWATVLVNSSVSVNTLSADIMDANEKYEMYNKRCTNARQIYIGDMPPYLWIDSVSYRGIDRNFELLDDVIELEVENSTILDSDSTLTNLQPVNVTVRFAVPHILCQLTDLDGALAASESEGDTSISIDSMGNTEIIEVGEQLHFEDLRNLYFITVEVTTSGNAATLTIYPPLEADLASSKTLTFRKSTLTPKLEEILCQRVAARAMLSNTVTKLDNSNKGGPEAYNRERRWAMDILAESNAELRSGVRAKAFRTLPRT